MDVAILINLFLFARTALGQVTANGGAPTVDLGYVKYQGYENATAGIYYFRGMRFGQAPVGDFRWRAPLPIESDTQWTGQTLNATEEGAICMQGYPEYFGTAGQNSLPASEDCLFADVLVPTNPISTNLPVIVQIHGGGYTEGYNGYLSAGDALVNRSNGNVIYVEIQYRLGLYGFVGGSQIAQNGDLNAGLLDQRAGLEWVQRHISAFGGDPAKVMITGWVLRNGSDGLGASAGGGSVMYQM
jgi:carboxylesterase type B